MHLRLPAQEGHRKHGRFTHEMLVIVPASGYHYVPSAYGVEPPPDLHEGTAKDAIGQLTCATFGRDEALANSAETLGTRRGWEIGGNMTRDTPR